MEPITCTRTIVTSNSLEVFKSKLVDHFKLFSEYICIIYRSILSNFRY